MIQSEYLRETLSEGTEASSKFCKTFSEETEALFEFCKCLQGHILVQLVNIPGLSAEVARSRTSEVREVRKRGVNITFDDALESERKEPEQYSS